MIQIPERVCQRAQDKHHVDSNGCWVSIYMRQGGGYAVLSAKDDGKSRVYLAHRASWTRSNGQIPDGLVIDHTCFNRPCVNPAHLRAIPLAENTRRRHGAAFPLGQCRWGHPLSEQREFRRKGRPQYVCGACVDQRNYEQTQIKVALRQLELAYGLGGHETKRNYAFEIAKRQGRVRAVRTSSSPTREVAN